MNIIQAFLTIIRNINRTLPYQKNAYRETAILAAIAIGYTTPPEIETAIHIDREQVRKIAKQLILEGLVTCELSITWPYRNQYALTPKGEKATATLLNYKNQTIRTKS